MTEEIARLRYSINTDGLHQAEWQLGRVRREGRRASDALQNIGGRRGSRRASDALVGIGTQATVTSRALSGTSLAAGGLISNLGRLRAAVGTIGTISIATNFIQASESYKTIQALLTNVTDSTEKFQRAQSGVIKVAKDTRSPLTDVTKLYARMAPVLKDAGESQATVLSSLDTVNKAIKLSAPTIQEATSSLQQFSQAIGKGRLDGDELRSILEGSPVLAQQLAKGLGVATGQLKEMGAQGKLTSDVVIAALIKQEAEINELFGNLPVKSGEAWQLVKDQATLAIGQIDNVLGVSSRWSGVLTSLADRVQVFGAQVLKGINYVQSLGLEFSFLSAVIGPIIPYLDEFLIALIGIGGTYLAVSGVVSVLTLLGGVVLSPVVAGIVAVAASAAFIYNNWEGVVDFWRELWASMQGIVESALDSIVSLVSRLADALREGSDRLFAPIEDEITAAMQKAGEIVDSGLTGAANIIGGASGMLGDAVGSAFDPVEPAIEGAFKNTGNIVGGALTEAANVIGRVAGQDVTQIGETVGSNTAQGIVDGILSNINIVEGASETLAQTATSVISEDMKAAGEKIGAEAVTGIVEGIEGNSARLKRATDLIAAANFNASESFSKTIAKLDKEIARAVRRSGTGYQSIIDGLRGAERETAQARLNELNAIRAKVEAEQLTARATEEFTKQQYIQNIALTEGADAARIAELEVRGYTDAQAKATLATERALKTQNRFRDGLVDAISNATNLTSALRNFGDFLERWLKEKIAFFAANKIIAYLGIGGLDSTQSAIGGVLDSLKGQATGIFDGLPDRAGEIFSGIKDSVSGLFGRGAVSGLSGSAGGLGAAGANAGRAGAAGASSFAAGGVITLALATIDQSVKNIKEINKEGRLVAAALGPIGIGLAGIAGSSLFGGRTQVTQGFQFGFDGENVTGNNTLDTSRRRSLFRGTRRTSELSELDDSIRRDLEGFFDTLKTSVTGNAELLGVEGADAILDSFTVATRKFAGANAEKELQEYLEDSTREAYRLAFDQLAPQLQELIKDRVNVADGSLVDLEQAFNSVGAIAGVIAPLMRDLGIEISDSIGTAAVQAELLADAMGGAEAAQRQFALYQREFLGDAFDDNVARRSQIELDKFNASINRTGDRAIRDRAGLVAYIDLLGDGSDAARAAAFEQLEAIISVEDAAIRQREKLEAVNDAFDLLNISTVSQDAANSLVKLAGGISEFSGLANQYYNDFFSEEERRNLSLRQSIDDVLDYNTDRGLTGDAAIDTVDEYRDHIEELNRAVAAGEVGANERLIAALELGGAMKTLTDRSNGLQDAMDRLPDGLSAINTEALNIIDARNRFPTPQNQPTESQGIGEFAVVSPRSASNDDSANEERRLLREEIIRLREEVAAGNSDNIEGLAAVAGATEDQTAKVETHDRDLDVILRELVNALESRAA